MSNSPQGLFRDCIVTEVSAWEIEEERGGKKTGRKDSYPYIGIFNGRENVQMPIHKDCIPPQGLEFGDRVDIWAEINQGQKVVSDRAIAKLGLRALSIERSASESNGHSRFVPLGSEVEPEVLAEVA